MTGSTETWRPMAARLAATWWDLPGGGGVLRCAWRDGRGTAVTLDLAQTDGADPSRTSWAWRTTTGRVLWLLDAGRA